MAPENTWSRISAGRPHTGGSKSVALVIPPSPFLLDERVFVSLGVLKVAASLRASGHDVRVLDLSGIENYLDTLSHYLRNHHDDAIGITTTTPQLPAAIAIAKTIREQSPQVRTVLGGPHVTLTYAAVKLEQKRGIQGGRAQAGASRLETAVDVLCPGDGELAMLQALSDRCPKVIDADDPRGPYFLTDEMFTKSPRPARDLVDMNSYHYEIEGHRATSLIAQLGCPFQCGFCGGRNSKSLRLIRKRSSESIVREIEHLHTQYGYTGFMFYDDELNVNRQLVPLMNQISDLQQRLGTEFRLRGFVKSELFDASQAEAMVRAGFRWLLCGFEAAHPRILKNINKRATIDDNTRCVEIAKQHGLKIKALMSCGHPGETAESVQAIRDWLIRSEVDDFDCTIITTYPGTPYYDEAVPHVAMPDVWTYSNPITGDALHSRDLDFTKTADYYKGDPSGGYRAFVFTDELSSEELVEQRDALETEVREKLDIPFNPARAALRYEHSMGQGLPDFILRGVKKSPAESKTTQGSTPAHPGLPFVSR